MVYPRWRMRNLRRQEQESFCMDPAEQVCNRRRQINENSLFHYFDRFLVEYEGRFEKEYGFLRPIIKEVVERYLDCGNPRCGFARIRCPDCQAEHLLMFSFRTRGFRPSCHAKRLETWGGWVGE